MNIELAKRTVATVYEFVRLAGADQKHIPTNGSLDWLMAYITFRFGRPFYGLTIGWYTAQPQAADRKYRARLPLEVSNASSFVQFELRQVSS